MGGLLNIIGNASLTDTSAFGGLTELSDALIFENAALTTLSLPGLTFVGARGPSPTSIGPSQRQLYVAMNPALTRLDLPALRFVGEGGVRVNNNAALPQCQADALATQVETTCTCSGKTGSATCG